MYFHVMTSSHINDVSCFNQQQLLFSTVLKHFAKFLACKYLGTVMELQSEGNYDLISSLAQ